MNDETKAALKYFRSNLESGDFVSGREEDAVKALLAHIDGEPERLAAAREEQREACALDAEERVGCASTYDEIRSVPLDARPLADRIAELEKELSKAEWRVAELEDDVADTRILLEPHFGHETLAKMTADLIARAEKAEARVEELEAQAATDDDHALVVNDAHLQTVAALRGRVAGLEAQRDEAVAALRALLREEWYIYEGNLEAAGHASVDDLNAARAVLAKHPEGR